MRMFLRMFLRIFTRPLKTRMQASRLRYFESNQPAIECALRVNTHAASRQFALARPRVCKPLRHSKKPREAAFC